MYRLKKRKRHSPIHRNVTINRILEPGPKRKCVPQPNASARATSTQRANCITINPRSNRNRVQEYQLTGQEKEQLDRDLWLSSTRSSTSFLSHSSFPTASKEGRQLELLCNFLEENDTTICFRFHFRSIEPLL